MAKASEIHPRSSILHLRPLFIVGPTAVGKSEIALLLAEKIGGEIISVDSMQVYRGLDIGTAKPSAKERARVRHHLIDVVDLTESFDAAQFVRLANAAVTEIQSRGHVPIFCGGTGLYFKAFLEGLGEAPPADEKLRAELEAAPLQELLAELREKDPVTYEKIDRNNPRRVIRAIEVIRLTSKKFSEQRAAWNLGAPALVAPNACEGGSRQRIEHADETSALPGAAHITGFSREVTDLRARIDARVDTMFARGLVEETRHLLEGGLEQNKTAMQALGYRQVVEHLRGEHSLPETVELVKIKTRQFAKRQMTWFKRQLSVEWINLAARDLPNEIAARISTL
jgi:tRNA dimethylallyltransferase